MKRFLFFFLGIILILHLQAQEKQPELQKENKTKKFSIGVNYTYIQSDLKLDSRTDHSIWQGLDYGETDLSKDEIDDINSFVQFSSLSHSICLEAGMILLNKPEGKWFIDGKILLGIAKTYYETYNKNKETKDLIVTTDFSRPCAGLQFLFRYSFTPHWGLTLSPFITYSWGTTKDIEDNLNPSFLNFTEDKKENSISLYSRIDLLANYTIKGFTISAGPGFYLTYNKRTYTNDKTNPENGSTYLNESKSAFYGKSFIDGCVNIDWRIIHSLDLSVNCGIGKDIIIHPGIRYMF